MAIDLTDMVEVMLSEKAAVGGFNYEKEVNDRLKKMGVAHKDSGTAGSSADAPDAKFHHNGKEHNLEIKQNSKAMFGQIELHHDGKQWDISERSKKKYPETHKAIHDSGFLKKVNKQWGKPTGDYDEDLKMGNVYHTHHDAEPIKAHYGKDRKTDYIQIGGGHGFYHTGKDAAKLGSPELEGKATLRARMKYRGTDKKTGKKKYGALVVMGLKDADKSHHNLDNDVQKEWIEDVLNGHKEFVTESRNQADKYWDEAEEHKSEAKKHKAGTEAHHFHMSNHYDAMHRYHSDLGQHREADKAADKAEDHHEKSLQASKNGLAEAAKDHTMEAHGIKGMKRTKWQKTFKSHEHAYEWAEKNDAEIHGTRDLEHIKPEIKEAHKIGDKVQIVKGSDAGTVGHIGEIRHGAYKGAPKTFTVFHGEKGATQVKKEHIKGLKEEAEYVTEETECFSNGFLSGQQEEPKVNPHTEGSAEYAEYENGYMQGVMTRRRMQVESHVEFRIDHRDKLTGDHKSTFAAHDAKVSDTTDKATYVKVPSHKADSFKSAMKGHGAKVELAEGLGRGREDDEGQGSGKSPRKDFFNDRPHTVHIDGKPWKKFSNAKQANAAANTLKLQGKKVNVIGHFKEETELEEATGQLSNKVTSHKHSHVLQKIKNGEWEAMTDVKPGKHVEVRNTSTGTRKMVNVLAEEEVAANNVGSGAIAGTQGDAGKKVVMTKEPLKRKTLAQFKSYVSQEHDQA